MGAADGARRAPLRSFRELDVSRRRVLVRCDLNVPLDDGRVADDLRIRASLPTLQTLLERGARVVVCSHLGRPKGKLVKELSMAPVKERLQELLRRDARLVSDVVGDEARRACGSDAAVVVLENLRFEAGEEANDPGFADRLAALADAYVNDAFGSSHRAHASVVGVAERLDAGAGLLMLDEVAHLERLVVDPEPPFVAVLGGAKVSDKLGVIAHLLERVQTMCVGGAMAFTLLAAQGREVGRSVVERERLDEVSDVLERARTTGVDILLPTDVVVADRPQRGAAHDVVETAGIGSRMGVDIGPETQATFATVIRGARTVVWNGPMGIFEIDDFARGTRAVAHAIADATKSGAYTVAGGGDSAAALAALEMTDAVSHLSTGGGATLEFLEGKDLPGVAVLRTGTTT
jgi:phosphoglycerate kinase